MRLQRKDGTLKSEQKQEFEMVNPNKSEIEDEIHNIHGNHNKNNSYIINNSKKNLILIEVIINAIFVK